MKILTIAGMILAGAATAGIYDAGLYSQVPLTDVSDANRAMYIADAKAAGVDAVWISVVDFFEEEARRKPVLDHLAAEIRHFEAAGFAVGVWINAFGYGNERPFFKDSMKITTLEGKAKGGAVCPLDPKLRRALIDNVRDIARAGAKFILMDDDYVQSARGLVGCSCPRHLARVAAKCGRQRVTCEDAKAAFTGAPNAVRTAYLDVTGEVAVELARELRRVVDEVDPAVGMGLCASYTHWDVEGCDLLELVGAFAGKGRKVLRISGAPYWANSKLPGTGLADIIEFVRMQSAWTRGLDMTVFDENDPYPRKVARVPPWRCELYDKAIIADGHLARHKYMLCYGPDRAEPGYLEAHLANLPDDAALRRIFAGTEPYGVKVECPQHRLRAATLPTPFAGEHYITALYSQPAAAFELRRKGIPTRFDGPASSDEPLAVMIKAPPAVYQIVQCDRKKGEYAVLLENMGGTAVDVQISVMGTVRVVEALRGTFSVVPGGLSLAQLPPHSYAAVRFHGGDFRAALADPLAWLYADSKVECVERLDEIDVPHDGVIDVNILLNGLTPGVPLAFSASIVNGEWYRMRAVPVKRNTGVRGFLEKNPGDNPHVARRAPFEVFDVLEPLSSTVIPSPAETEALRFRLDGAPSGPSRFTIRIRVEQGGTVRELPLKVVVHPVALPRVGKDSFKYTNWMSLGNMAGSHGLKPWSEEHWKMIEKYVRLAARGRQNVGLMREVFIHRADGTVTLDKDRFSRLLDIYSRAGLWYLEGPHLAGFVNGWGSPAFKTSYTTNVTTTVPGALALSKMARSLMEEIDARGLRDRWYQHVADEPGGKNVSEYRITAGIVRRYMPGIRTVDAVEEPSFAGALDVWCPKVDAYERYRDLYDGFRTNFGDRVWCYTCCIPGGKWMNRTMDGELLRPALLPWVAVMYEIDGFLHWGYNCWQRGQGQDPFKDPYPQKWGGSNNGNSLPPGDTHIVYPGPDGPWPSVRLEATRAGMEDADLIAALRRRDKNLADALVRRIARGFSDYETSCRLYREVRREILRNSR